MELENNLIRPLHSLSLQFELTLLNETTFSNKWFMLSCNVGNVGWEDLIRKMCGGSFWLVQECEGARGCKAESAACNFKCMEEDYIPKSIRYFNDHKQKTVVQVR